NNIEDYADILKDTFARCEIPYFLSMSKPVMHTSIMVFINSLLDLLTARKLKTENIFRLIKCGLLDIPVKNDSLTDIAQFDNYCYKWNIDGDTWNQPFIDEKDENIEEIRKSVIEPIKKVKNKISHKNKAVDICRIIYEYLAECGTEKSINHMMHELIKNGRDYEASELKRLWSCVMDILDSIAETLGEKVISFSEMSRIIKSMIGRIEYSVPPQTLDSVMTASARTARLSSPKVVFVIGANEGIFPSNSSQHGLFSETDKCKLYEKGIEISHPLSEIISAERLVVYKALSYASDKLFITYTLSDLSGTSKYPASVTDNIIEMFNDNSIRLKKEDIPQDYYAVTLHSAFYHYMQNVSQNNVYNASIKKILMEVPEYKSRIEYITDRSQFRQDYRIDTGVMKKLKSFEPLKLSATGVEDYNKCHFMYFCKNFLKLKEYKKVEINSIEIGNIIHYCFCKILMNTNKEQFINLSLEELRKLIKKYAEEYKNEKLSGNFSKNSSFEFMFRKIIDFALFAFIHLQNELKHTDFVPKKFEIELRDKYALSLDFGDGYKLNLDGKIERADVWTKDNKKYLRIIDYKSIVKTKNITVETLAGGLNLQMLIYLFVATEENGFFSGYIPAGVLYSPFFAKDISSNT
ncbi:MAG: PD-(D/E)XK nuclease family protein, partial [Ruminococcus sp.]|nr:PD-(D/E)XK nuclease family protein [Ruminococcus sp.]